ncbi:MAG: hypothetical protein ACI9EW_003601, partial [Cellvibrionaceae bacterium]
AVSPAKANETTSLFGSDWQPTNRNKNRYRECNQKNLPFFIGNSPLAIEMTD